MIKHYLLFYDTEFSKEENISILELVVKLPFRLNIKDEVSSVIDLKNKKFIKIEHQELKLLENYKFKSGYWEIESQFIKYDIFFKPYIRCNCRFVYYPSPEFLDK